MNAQENKLNLNNIAIVLVEPLVSGNIGSVARAMMNMGFDDLRLVNPQANHLDMEARWIAHGSQQLLEKAKVFSTIEESVSDSCVVIASSHRKVRNSQSSFSARELGEKIFPYCQQNKVAILFGRENHGLSNKEVNLCTWLVNIPTASSYPALNLSQAVMLIGYELFMHSSPRTVNVMPKLVGGKDMKIFYQNVLEIIDMAGFHHKNKRTDIFIGALRRIFGRTGLEEQDLRVLYKFFKQVKILAKNSPSSHQP